MSTPTYATKKFKFGTITARVARKFSQCMIFIEINTSEKMLLFSINRKFKAEKCLSNIALNPNNQISGCYIGEGGIIITCPEAKICTNIIQYMNYINKCQLKPKQYFSDKESDYVKFHRDINNVNIHILGHCKTFIKNHLSQSSKKIEVLEKSLTSLPDKTCSNVVNKSFKLENLHSIEFDDKVIIETLVLLKSHDYFFSGKEIKLISCNCSQKIYKDTYRSVLKSFATSVGTYGKEPASGDKKAYEEKVSMVKNALNDLCEMVCKLHCKPKQIIDISSEDFSTHLKLVTDVLFSA